MLAPLIALLLTQEPPAPPQEREKLDLVQTVRGPAGSDLEWSDAEDRLHGSVRPLELVSGRPVELSVLVGTFQGAVEFDGPVNVTLRCAEWSDSQTVRRAKGEKAWAVKFVPSSSGEDCSLDFAFTTTRHKRLHTKLYVQAAPLARWPWFVLLGLGSAIALGLGIRAVLKKPETA